MERFDLLLNNFEALNKELKVVGNQIRVENKDLFNAIVENSTNFIAIVQDGKYVFINSRGLDLLKCKSSADIIGTNVSDTVHPDYQESFFSHLLNAESEPKNPIYIKIIRSDGSVFDSESNSLPFFYNKKPAILIIGRDITEELEQKATVQQEQQLRTDILNSFKEVVAFYEPNHKIKWMNHAGKQQLSLTDDSYIGKYCYKIWFGTAKPCKECPIVTKHIEPSERLVTFMDESIWLVRHIPMFDNDNNLTGFIEFRENVTEKEKTKQELEKSRARQIKAELNALLGYFEYDLNTNTVIWSPGVYQIVGLPYKPNQSEGKFDFVKHIHSGDAERVMYHLNRSFTEYIKFDQVYRMYDTAGNLKIIHGQGEVVEDVEKNTKNFFGTIRDMTKEIEIDKKNKQLAADSLYINQKNKILHEIETELNKVLNSKKVFQKKDFQDIINIIGSYSKLDKDWDLLKSYFEEIHSSFFHKLEETHPVLTTNDIKHCACIKLNFSTKEIARFFNIKEASVQIARVRLKKKMNLSETTDLRNYILTF